MYAETLKLVAWSCNNISQNLEYIFLVFKLIQIYFSDWFDIKEYSEITTQEVFFFSSFFSTTGCVYSDYAMADLAYNIDLFTIL